MFRVATVRSCASAEAAMRLSLIGMEWPVDGNALFVLAKPIQNPAIRVRLGGLAENIGIDEKLHKESVDSDSIS